MKRWGDLNIPRDFCDKVILKYSKLFWCHLHMGKDLLCKIDPNPV